jgi:hypothetical protein
MGVILDKVTRIFAKAKLANALLNLTITRNAGENTIDITGDPDSNPNYGEIDDATPSTISIEAYLEPLPTGSRLNGSYVKGEDTGYSTKDMIIVRTMTELKEFDTFIHPSNYIYEIRQANSYYEQNSTSEFVYSECVAYKKENQGI